MAEIDKEAFRAAVVHDMRAPLNACLMSLSLIELKASRPADVLKSVDVIRRNLERQALLIDDLGDALQIVEGGLTLEREDTDLVEMTDSAAERIREATGVTIDWSGERPGGCRVLADPERLGRAIGTVLELIASEAGTGGRVALAARIEDGTVGIEVRRMPSADDDSGTRRKRPTMRLTVAEAIVARHEGRLEIGTDHATVSVPVPAR